MFFLIRFDLQPITCFRKTSSVAWVEDAVRKKYFEVLENTEPGWTARALRSFYGIFANV